MKQYGKRWLSAVLAAGIFLGITGCGTEGNAVSSLVSSPSAELSSESPLHPFEGETLTYAIGEMTSETQAVVEMVEEKTGIQIECESLPSNVDGEIDSAMARMLSGYEIDIYYEAEPNMKKFYNAALLTPMEDLAEQAGYDLESIHGEYLPVFEGQVYGLPAFIDIWLTLYNKRLFDAANLPYPSAEGWTWEKYLETAQQLTDLSDGQYGSLMLDYNTYNYMYAEQCGVSHYKEDGSSNYDDPVFAKGLQFFYDLGNRYQVQPSLVEFKAKQMSWDEFFTTGKYGMFVAGGWSLNMAADREKYPREWKMGILPMPYPEGQQPSTLTTIGCYFIPVTSKKQQAAFAAISCMAQYQYTLGAGRIPARTDLSQEELSHYIQNSLAVPFEQDGITAEDFETAWFDPNRLHYDEKVRGKGDSAINQIWIEEGMDYANSKQTLEQTMQNIKRRSDQAIIEDVGA